LDKTRHSGDEKTSRNFLADRNRIFSGRSFGRSCSGPDVQGLQERIRFVHDRACDPIPGNDKQVACHCTVNQGYSAGREPCQGVKETPDGQQIRSRYYPVKSYAVCSNDRPWAWCLDKPCIVDKNNPQAALCTCDAVKNLGDYIIVTSKYTSATCATGVISSATVQQSEQITDYLKNKTKALPPFPIQVLNK
jgi:hypothetical protein